jgi:hypothetical protein
MTPYLQDSASGAATARRRYWTLAGQRLLVVSDVEDPGLREPGEELEV